MAFALIDYPDGCLNLSKSCCAVEYSEGNLLESAYVAWDVKIYDTDIADAVAGSTLAVRGALFTFAAAADTSKNIIAISVAGIQAGFLANHWIISNFDHGVVGSYVWIRPKVRSWDVAATLSGLDAAPSSRTLSAVPTPVKAREAYGVICSVEYQDGEDTYKLFDATIPAEFESDPSHETIVAASVVIKKDLGNLFDAYLSSVLPTIPAVANGVTPHTDISKNFTLKGQEIWGIPTNFFGAAVPVLGQAVHITKGALKVGETALAFCDKNAYTCMPKTIHCQQPVFCSIYDPAGGAGTPQWTISTKDASGSTLGTTTETGTGALTYVWTLVTRFDVYIYADSVEQLRIQIKNGGISGTTYNMAINRQPAGTLVYKTSKEVYNSIMVQPLSEAQVGNATDFISKCRPCGGDSTSVVREAVNTESYQDVSFTLFNENLYYECELQELFSSTEVYLVKDNKLYFIEPKNSGTKVFEYRGNTNPVFKGKLLLT